MFPAVDPTKTIAWEKLTKFYQEKKNKKISDLFLNDKTRFEKFSLSTNHILFDYSKNTIDDEVLSALLELADECKLAEAIKAMFNGEKINQTETRAVLHTALRHFNDDTFFVDGKNILPEIDEVLDQMEKF